MLCDDKRRPDSDNNNNNNNNNSNSIAVVSRTHCRRGGQVADYGRGKVGPHVSPRPPSQPQHHIGGPVARDVLRGCSHLREVARSNNSRICGRSGERGASGTGGSTGCTGPTLSQRNGVLAPPYHDKGPINRHTGRWKDPRSCTRLYHLEEEVPDGPVQGCGSGPRGQVQCRGWVPQACSTLHTRLATVTATTTATTTSGFAVEGTG